MIILLPFLKIKLDYIPVGPNIISTKEKNRVVKKIFELSISYKKQSEAALIYKNIFNLVNLSIHLQAKI
ncbi:hypothetical protein ACVWYG_001081 [Pedobacter sp. UYEF25]